MTEIFLYQWSCKACGSSNNIERTKFEAAFDHSPKRSPCVKCGGVEYKSASSSMPEIDEELLEFWYEDPTLYFLDQDEDLIIAGAELKVLKAFLQAGTDSKMRASIMGPILAIKFYDDCCSADFQNEEDRQWCIDWLIKNRHSWVESSAEYIKTKINPILDFEKKRKND